MSTMEMSTQEAADLLNVSRPTLIQMLDTGALEYRNVGTHRRIFVESLMAHKHKLDADRRTALAELSAYDQEIGL
jgi:excisionase family DNA binding protein